MAQQHQDLSRAYTRLRLWAILLHAGNVVPTFSTSTLDSERVTIGATSSPETRQVLFILHTTCPYSRATLPVWERIADSLRRAVTPKIELYGISLDAADSTRAYVHANRLSYPVLLFPERKLVDLYRAQLTPETVVLDARGRVLYARTGMSTISRWSSQMMRRGGARPRSNAGGLASGGVGGASIIGPPTSARGA